MMLKSPAALAASALGAQVALGASADGPVEITQGAVTAWLRAANATVVSGDVSSLPDMLNANPAVQTQSSRRPTLATANNGLPILTFATNDVLSWPITAQSSPSNYAGYGFWVNVTTVSTTERILHISTAAVGGASGIKFTFRKLSSFWVMAASPDGSTSKTNTAGVPVTGWQFVTAEYDKDGSTDAAKMTTTINGTPVTSGIGGTATLGALFAATGNILIGNGTDDGTGSSPFNGSLGPNIYVFGSKMAGATTGLLTSAARTALMNYEAPT